MKEEVQNWFKQAEADLRSAKNSREAGDYLADSDYDIILVSPDFEGVFFSQRSELMYDFRRHWPLEIEPLGYTPEEFEAKRRQVGIVGEAVKEGIAL